MYLFEVERKAFQVKFEGSNGGTWISITERSRGFVVSIGFGEEELDWLSEHLKKVVELEASRGFIRKIRGKTRTHLMEICFNSRGRFMKITEFVTKRKPLVLVIPEGVKGNGWEALRKVISSIQDLSNQAVRASKEMIKDSQVSKGIYREDRSYADVVAEEGPRNGALLPVEKWARAVICERVLFLDSARRADWFQEHGILIVRGGTVVLRRWSPRENTVKWRKVTKVARESLKLVDLSKVKLWVEMFPNVVLPALLEVEDGTWFFTVMVSVVGEVEGDDLLRPESTRNKDELMSTGVTSLRGQRTLRGYGLLLGAMSATARASSSIPFSFLSFKYGFHSEERRGRKSLGPSGGKRILRKGVPSIDHSQESSKIKGPSISARRKARSWPLSLKVSSSASKHNLDGGGFAEANLAIFRGKPVSNKGVLPPVPETFQFFTGETEEGDGFSRCGLANKVCPPFSASSEQGHPLAGAFAPKSLPISSVSTVHPFWCQHFFSFPMESVLPSQGVPFSIPPGGELSRHVGVSCSEDMASPVRLRRQSQNLPPSHWKFFQIEGLAPRKMVKVQSVLESLRIRIVRDNGKGVEVESMSTLSANKILSWNIRGLGSKKKMRIVKRLLSSQSPDVVMLQETKREFGIGGGIVITWDSNKFKCTEKVLGSFSVTVKLNSGGDFNVIRRISEKLGDSRLTFNMRCFDEFIRERFENMWLLHPEFKEKLSDWWQECMVEGWEGRIDLIEQEGNLNLDLVSERTLRRRKLEDLLLKEEVHWRQKSRVKWTKEGDCNSKFFHRMANGRRSRKFIKSLISEREVTLSNIEIISKEIINFFGKLYSKPEVYQECWDVIKEDLMRVFLEFHTNGIINQRCLRKALHEIVSSSQGAFVEGRHILDAVLIAMKWWMRKKDHVLERTGFSSKWRSWIRGCLSSSSFAILVNGNAKGWVKASRDDTIFFSKASLEHLQNLKIILLVFGQVSSLKINLEKSTISGINTGQELGREFVFGKIIGRLNVFSLSLADSREWSLTSSGLFSVKSFLLALSKVSNPILFLPAKFLWSSKAQSKAKALAWLVAHGKVNTNDKLQLRRPYKSLRPHRCILCKGNGESIDHLFLHCPITIGLWHKLFNLAGLAWVPPRSIEDMLVIAFKGLGNSLILPYFVMDFEDKGRTEEMLSVE
ncbi:hypothetical protein CK203_039266 [Vitis vinifera]|uniref:Reverse transcriptase zinc-binding domain-containing protein n=1 Tax=Vitis vinifera TaxID=29760 RepID=A0A438HGN7_VITVI|nr:hypothetical protein CK203_039266 [Vitis vinifera]